MSRPAPEASGEGGVVDSWEHRMQPVGAPAPSTGETPSRKRGSASGRHAAPRRRSRMQSFAELPVLVLVAFILALLLKTFLVQAFYIPSESMMPTLAVGDRVLVNKLAHDFREPRRGEVIVFSQEDGVPGAEPSSNPFVNILQSLGSGLGFVQTGEKDFIKRIMGLPGETIEMREGVVYVDGVPVPEASQDQGGYLSRPDLVDFGPVEVPEHEYFLMGDNRPNSSDSRSTLSTIHEDDIIGRAFVIVWPFNRFSSLSIPDFGSADVAATAETSMLEPAAPSLDVGPAVEVQPPDRAPADVARAP